MGLKSAFALVFVLSGVPRPSFAANGRETPLSNLTIGQGHAEVRLATDSANLRMLHFRIRSQDLEGVSANLPLEVWISARGLTAIDPARELLRRIVVPANENREYWIPLGTWSRRSDVRVRFQLTGGLALPTHRKIQVQELREIAVGPVTRLSIVRSNLLDLGPNPPITVQQLTDRLLEVPADWFRTGLPYRPDTDSAENVDIDKPSVQGRVREWALEMSQQLRRIQGQGRKILLVTRPDLTSYRPADLDSNNPTGLNARPYLGSAEFAERCGYKGSSLRFSMTDFRRYQKSLRLKLEVLKQQGVRVGAIEIGNELDWVCFNADLPLDTNWGSKDEIRDFARLYGRLLKSSVDVVHEIYPEALVVSFGMAQPILGSLCPSARSASDRIGLDCELRGYIDRPGRILAELKRMNYAPGKSYFSLIQRIGLHLYPTKKGIDRLPAALQTFGFDAVNIADAQDARPYWVTEFGYRSMADTREDSRDRYRAFAETMDFFYRMPRPRVENAFVYAYDNPRGMTLVRKPVFRRDEDGQVLRDVDYSLRPEARFMWDYGTLLKKANP